jgi:hypothetical protein
VRIAKAVRRALDWPEGRGWVDIYPTGPDNCRAFDAFDAAGFIRDFDKGRPVYPFCFWFERADPRPCEVPGLSRKPTRRTPRHTGGRAAIRRGSNKE